MKWKRIVFLYTIFLDPPEKKNPKNVRNKHEEMKEQIDLFY